MSTCTMTTAGPSSVSLLNTARPTPPPAALGPESTLTDSTGREGSFKEWNRLADAMERFHGHFRWEFENIYESAAGGYSREGHNLDRFLREAEQLAHHLDMHHRIEEAYVFPLLAKKIPAFGADARGEHVESHKRIHASMTHYEKYLAAAKADPKMYDPAHLRMLMDGFKDVLFTHLAEEVHDLGAQSMWSHGFTLEELRSFPM